MKCLVYCEIDHAYLLVAGGSSLLLDRWSEWKRLWQQKWFLGKKLMVRTARRGEDGDIVVINSWVGELHNPDLLLRKADFD